MPQVGGAWAREAGEGGTPGVHRQGCGAVVPGAGELSALAGVERKGNTANHRQTQMRAEPRKSRRWSRWRKCKVSKFLNFRWELLHAAQI